MQVTFEQQNFLLNNLGQNVRHEQRGSSCAAPRLGRQEGEHRGVFLGDPRFKGSINGRAEFFDVTWQVQNLPRSVRC
jgi:hypothetical protein